MRLEITAHAGCGPHDYLWDYGSRPDRHARMNSLLGAIREATGSHIPDDGDNYCDGIVVWEIDDDDWAEMPAGLLRRVSRCGDIRCCEPIGKRCPPYARP